MRAIVCTLYGQTRQDMPQQARVDRYGMPTVFIPPDAQECFTCRQRPSAIFDRGSANRVLETGIFRPLKTHHERTV